MNVRQLVAASLSLSLLLAGSVQAQEADADAMAPPPNYGTVVGIGPEPSGSTVDVYVVRPGDTLWHICGRFFGNERYWPSLWSINNDEVTNPHYIFPGQLLRFRPGTDTTPPGLDQYADYSFQSTFTPLVNYRATDRDCRVDIPFLNRSGEYTVRAPGFLGPDDLDSLGVVFRSREPKLLLGENDEVYLKFRNLDEVNCGDIYTVYSPTVVVRHPAVRRLKLGTLYRIHAEVLVTDVTEYLAVGTIVQSVDDVPRGAFVGERLPIVSRLVFNENDRDIDGYLVAQLNNEALTMQRNEVVFVDRGRADGLRPGNTMWVVRRGDAFIRGSTEDTTLPDYVVGRLVIYSADENHSTAILTDAARPIEVGDRVTTQLDD